LALPVACSLLVRNARMATNRAACRATTILALAALGWAGVSGCGRPGADQPAPANPEGTGSISVALHLATGTISVATYTITGPHGFTRTGSIDLSQSTTVSAVIAGLPAGTGYQITINAATTDGATACAGSATFDVAAGQTRAITVPLACHEAPRLGSVLVAGSLNICPTVDGVDASATEVAVGGRIALSGHAHDVDEGPGPLTYNWTSTSGSFTSHTIPNPIFTCTTTGTVTVTVTVSDGDPAPSCAGGFNVMVVCVPAQPLFGFYLAGDFNNHTTCSDGTTSMQALVRNAAEPSAPWALDWLVQADGGGKGNRNCTLPESGTLSTPAYRFVPGLGPSTSWESSGATLRGDVSGTSPNRDMWRWQSIAEQQYPLIEYLNVRDDRPLFLGLETNVPGHDAAAVSISFGQAPALLDTTPLPAAPPYSPLGVAHALSEWEYCFDRLDTDTVGPANADCSLPSSANVVGGLGINELDATHKLVPAAGPGSGTRGHQVAVDSAFFLGADEFLRTAYYVPSHVERGGPFDPDGNAGYNIEHLRDLNNAAPTAVIGMEAVPGHAAAANRGDYGVLRNVIGGVPTDSAGGTTYGGAGVYTAQIGGVWDALLGDDRAFWVFGNSEWTSRGMFAADDRRSTGDFYPGEYVRNHTLVANLDRSGRLRPLDVTQAIRQGNTFVTEGQLIDRLAFFACTGTTDAHMAEFVLGAAVNNGNLDFDFPSDIQNCAGMGEILLPFSNDIVVGIAVRDPVGPNFSPYTFLNPSLQQVGISQPLDMPALHHIDLIDGQIPFAGLTPQTGAPNYAGEWPRNTAWLHADGTTAGLSAVPAAAKNPGAGVLNTFSGGGASPWQAVVSPDDGNTYLVMTFRIPAATTSQFIRLRGTNLPPMVPFETDAAGNPLPDVFTNASDTTRLRIPCTTPHSAYSQFDGCPDHLARATGTDNPIAGQPAVSYDVAAWADLWFYSNPILISSQPFPLHSLINLGE
jgi:hypothetical protein